MIHNYSFPTQICFGAGAIQELAPYLKSQGLKRPLVVTDPQVAKLDFFSKILNLLESQDMAPQVFSEVSPNPLKSDVLKGRESYQNLDADSVIGLGGGAALDTARAIVLSIHHTRDLFDYDDLIGGSVYITEEVPHFITIPTTAGTGSEVGRAAVISEDESKKKRILFHPKLMARQVFADPELTYGLPPFVTAATGMDALTHHMEAFLSKGEHPMADGIALEGMRMISQNLKQATQEGTPESRAQMMIAALMGAVAFQKGLGVVHSMAHPLSAKFNVHHGLANALCIPHGMRFNISGFEDRFARIAAALGLKDTSPEKAGEAVVQYLTQLTKELGLPQGLKSQGVSESDVNTLAQLGLEDFCHPSNPKPVTLKDFQELYRHAL